MFELIDVSQSGAVLLGKEISCDGFHRDFPARIQTHIHDDHMDDFETSKGAQQIFMSDATRGLLVVEYNADLAYRSNISALPWGAEAQIEHSRVTLLQNGHMLGSTQVAVTLADGTRVGYSGDFHWPLAEVMQVDALVVDSTYGSPSRVREYSQEDAEHALRRLVAGLLKEGPVYIKAHRGTLQRALTALSSEFDCPFLGSLRLCAEVDVYREHGYEIGELIDSQSEHGKLALREGRFVRFYGSRDTMPVNFECGATVGLSAFMSRPEDPVMKFAERKYSVALSNHADFAGTLAYVEATGAKYVVTDNRRGSHGVELARELTTRLGIHARPSSTEDTREWGI